MNYSVDPGASDLSKPNVLVAQDLELGEVIRSLADGRFTSVVQASPNIGDDLEVAARLAVEPERVFANPMSSLIHPFQSGPDMEKSIAGLKVEFGSTVEMWSIRQKIDLYLDGVGLPRFLRPEVHLIADELMTNAIFNAPYPFREEEPNQNVVRLRPSNRLPGSAKAVIFMARNGDELLIGCEDPFASLSPVRVLSRLAKCHEGGIFNSIRWNTRGAGIGCFMILERSRSLLLAVDQRSKTIIACKVSLLRGKRGGPSHQKTIHCLNL